MALGHSRKQKENKMTIPIPKLNYRIFIREDGKLSELTQGTAISGQQAIKEFKADNPEFRKYDMVAQEIKRIKK